MIAARVGKVVLVLCLLAGLLLAEAVPSFHQHAAGKSGKCTLCQNSNFSLAPVADPHRYRPQLQTCCDLLCEDVLVPHGSSSRMLRPRAPPLVGSPA
jgi:hypothetical protein